MKRELYSCPNYIRYEDARGKLIYVAWCILSPEHSGRCKAPPGSLRWARDKADGKPFGTKDWPSLTISPEECHRNWAWERLGKYKNWWKWSKDWDLTQHARTVWGLSSTMPVWEVGMRASYHAATTEKG